MIFEQKGTLPVPIGKLWDFMIDPFAVSACMPGLEQFTEVDADHYQGTVRVKIGPISVRLQGALLITERDRENWTAQMTGKAHELRMASGVEVRLTVNLTATGATETQLRVLTEVKVLGKLGEFGQPIMKKSADRMLQQFLNNVAERIGTARDVDGASGERLPPDGKQ